jgi:CDP-6-deoxy-D-xylo-4-hexulose-3-dehydrase
MPSQYSKLAVDSVDEGDKSLAAIHQHITAYCGAHHNFRFDPANPVVRLHEPTFGAEEIIAAVDQLLSTKVTMGPKVKQFEREFCRAYGFSHGVTNNSGSSANLLAVAATANKVTRDGLRPGDEVIVPALSWSTTVWPLVQHNLVPVVVDIDRKTLNMDAAEVERAIGQKTRGIMPVHVYGNPCDMDALLDLSKRRNLVMIEDCCEALGSFYDGKPVGKFGRAGTFSFYFSHHMTTLEGGICVSEDFELAELMRVLRAHGWTRELEKRQPYLDKHPDFHPGFLFINSGYNLRITELQGAMGLVQLPKLCGFIEKRRENTQAWQKELARWGEHLEFQAETPKGRSSCFGFAILVKESAPFKVADITAFLEKAHIETRPIICGNIALQPAMKLYEHRVAGALKNSTRVMRQGFSVGNHQAVDQQARAYMTCKIGEFMAQRGLR